MTAHKRMFFGVFRILPEAKKICSVNLISVRVTTVSKLTSFIPFIVSIFITSYPLHLVSIKAFTLYCRSHLPVIPYTLKDSESNIINSSIVKTNVDFLRLFMLSNFQFTILSTLYFAFRSSFYSFLMPLFINSNDKISFFSTWVLTKANVSIS